MYIYKCRYVYSIMYIYIYLHHFTSRCGSNLAIDLASATAAEGLADPPRISGHAAAPLETHAQAWAKQMSGTAGAAGTR